MLDDFEQLKREVEELQSLKDRKLGGREQLIARLKKDYGLKTLAEAEAALVVAEEEERATARRYTKRKERFEREFRSKLKEAGL